MEGDIKDYLVSSRHFIFYILELGNGWAPVILETEEEFNFVRAADRIINNPRNYWIDGSTNNCCIAEIEYSDYIQGDRGKYADSNSFKT